MITIAAGTKERFYIRHCGIKAILGFLCFVIVPIDNSFSQYRSEKKYPGSQFEGFLIEEIIIDNRNIYDTEEREFDNFLFRVVNKLHYKTRKSIIEREILLNKGEKFSLELAEETVRNLRARLSLYDAWFEIKPVSDSSLSLKIITSDEWTLTTALDINREANETNSRIRIEESNFLGNNQFLGFRYFIREKEENYSELIYLNKRVGGNPLNFSAFYSNNPLGSYKNVSLGHPYYSLSKTDAYATRVNFRSGRIDRYLDEVRVAESHFEGERFQIIFSRRYGSSSRKIQFKPSYDYVREINLSNTLFDSTTLVVFPEDSTYHQLSLSIKVAEFGFEKLRRIDGFGFTEDFTVGKSLEIIFARAYDSRLKSIHYDYLALLSGKSFYHKKSLFNFSLISENWFPDDRLTRASTRFSFGFYNNHFNHFTLAIKTTFLSEWRKDKTDNLILGGSGGLRGFEKFYKTGDRIALFNVEGRFFTKVKILSAQIGYAFFSDFGRSWKSRESFKFKDFDMSVGAGLRLYLERFSSSKVLRIDFTHSDRFGWQISIGTGQFFRSNLNRLLLTNL